MFTQKQKIGIYGGTFDPIHMGHLISADCIRDELCLDQVIFVPAKVPPHKRSKNITDGHHRYQMIKLSIENNPHYQVSNFELDSPYEISFTWYTVQYFRNQYPDAQLFLLLGADTVLDLPNWAFIREICQECTLVGFQRAGEVKLESETQYLDCQNIQIINTPSVDISATMIRDRITNNQSVSYMVNNRVLEYIKEHTLYGKMETMDRRG
ncbi:nicotinate-nucleotide adenylyltransferase [Desulfuribacillus stibiiarsenatis]|uniref:nicotinate-nucleotide adenylyltransferase n=1 Tax=Desulfuribacillus stibiiarsenatis TaxID=1390249 RepID=UPI00159F1B00|nr:nicotinate-nucleotide adenylyltransferase [Desulfuribacillus stibiiarsenatis]